MSSGQKTLVINPQERAVSSDINRAQAFRGRDQAEVLRYLLNVRAGKDDLDGAGIDVEYASTEAPLRAEILNGLLVRPQIGSLALRVDAGMLAAIDPDAAPSADDSAYKIIRDPGVTSALTMTTGSGSARIDVIECARVAAPGYTVLETDNRDIFNSSTGLFTPVTVPKVVEGRLQYRVRAGTPGGGFPGTVTGWLPLAVALVPASAADTDAMTFWDVRPLVSDRAHGVMNITEDRPVHVKSMANSTVLASSAGLVDAILNGRKLGGMLRAGTPVADADSINLSDIANNGDPGMAFVANTLWYLYLATPFGLPRWARYTTAASGSRLPRAPRGIPVITTMPPDAAGKPSGAFSMPASTGLGGTTSEALCVFAGAVGSGGAQLGFFGDNISGYIHTGDGGVAGSPLEIAGSSSGSGTTALFASFTLNGGSHFPTHARALLVEPRCIINDSVGSGYETAVYINVFAPNGGARLIRMRAYGSPYSVGGAASKLTVGAAMWIPVPPVYPSLAAFTFNVEVELKNTVTITATFTDVNLRVLGWKF